ncbi:sulfite exporter TauE/SafE family protein [Methylovirgula sp. 4M-Z18]|uniref:sulfite exporter TauE/SafE family protein n=1 Tax=Methylovirgula sp. 4M-Z18 TaxID=2293567 RepID=UPI000E2F8133|nr:sulfite exporter TauE/SafE family protein [Methylovirgula sp. 4M-Z18]RFB76288.1 sulfite exporter TauE/SafE family protein [Methylovirgula sp. 4M-Z18]
MASLIDFLHRLNPLFTLSGFAIGALVGLTGVGGGSLMTPVLVLLFHVHPPTAVGTDLLYAGLTKIGGAFVHGRNETVDWRVTRRLAMGSVPAAIITLLALAHFGQNGATTNQIITTTLGFALILTAIFLLAQTWVLDRAAALKDVTVKRARVRGFTILLGAVLGVMVSISSVGAGAIGVTILWMLYPKLPTVRIVGSDIAHAVPLTLIAGVGYWWLGSIDWAMLVSLLFGSIPGISIASHFSARVPDRVLRPLLACTLLLVGGRLVF